MTIPESTPPPHPTPTPALCQCADLERLKERVGRLDRDVNGNGQPGRIDRLEKRLLEEITISHGTLAKQIVALQEQLAEQGRMFALVRDSTAREVRRLEHRLWRTQMAVAIVSVSGGGTLGWIAKAMIGG